MTKKVTFCGMCCALSVVIAMLTDFLPYNTVFLICAATALFPLVKVKCGTGWAFASVAAAVGVGFIIMANKLFWTGYVLLSLYAVLKGIIEKINKMIPEILIKLVVCGASIGLIRLIFPVMLPVYMYAGAVVVFFIYDFALSIFVGYMCKKLRFFQ